MSFREIACFQYLLFNANVMSFRGTPVLSVINQIVSRECLTDDVKLINVFDAFPKRIVSETKFRSYVTDDVMID